MESSSERIDTALSRSGPWRSPSMVAIGANSLGIGRPSSSPISGGRPWASR